MKYKVGDRVRIQSKEWYDKHKDEYGEIRGAFFDKDRAKLCGTIQTIANKGFINGSGVIIYAIEDAYEFIGEEAIEGLVKESDDFEKMCMESEKRYEEEYSTGEYCHEQSFKWGFQEGYNYSHENDKLEISLKDGYQFVDENGNVINATKIVLEKKKKEYPKTYEECLKVLGYDDRETYCILHTGAAERLFEALYRLKVCRDAYWKIAGEEMGLGKPWEPDYDSGVDKFGIVYFDNTIMRTGALHRWERHLNKVLEFPTEEMRDAFYDNFKELINECKELL